MTTSIDLNWDLLRVFLAAMRSQSLRQAAAQLGVSHPTIRRRLKMLEDQVGFPLFDRRSESLHATPQASELLKKAEEVEASVHAFARCAGNADPQLRGVIHVSAPDLVMSELLGPDLAAFSRRWPEIDLHIETTYELADLGNREADIAFRIVGKHTTPNWDLTGRKAAVMYGAVYGEGDHWIGWPEHEQQLAMIKSTPFAHLPIKGLVNNVYLQRTLCKEGMGLTLLPCFMADPWLKRRTQPEAVADLWVLVHPDLRRNPRLRLFRDEMVKALKNHQEVLAGKGPMLSGS